MLPLSAKSTTLPTWLTLTYSLMELGIMIPLLSKKELVWPILSLPPSMTLIATLLLDTLSCNLKNT
jgi:hypothetical protein